jgi:hypothetical protein
MNRKEMSHMQQERFGVQLWAHEMTRSRTQLEGKASAVAGGTETVEAQEECERVLQLEEPLKGPGAIASRQDPVMS